ncbi:MAG TPA: cupin domain-containing protein [Solirubrobacterales bacterium]
MTTIALPLEVGELRAMLPDDPIGGIEWGAADTRALIESDPAQVRGQADVETILAVGGTVIVDRVSSLLPALRRPERMLGERVGIPSGLCEAKLFLSGPGGGLPLHFDRFDSIQIQLAGEKRWQLTPGVAVSCPLHSHLAGADPMPALSRYCDPEDLLAPPREEVIFLPGQTLHIAAGRWHATEVSEGISISLAMRLAIPSWIHLLTPDSRQLALGDSAFRQRTAGFWDGGGRLSAAGEAHLRQLLARPDAGTCTVGDGVGSRFDPLAVLE